MLNLLTMSKNDYKAPKASKRELYPMGFIMIACIWIVVSSRWYLSALIGYKGNAHEARLPRCRGNKSVFTGRNSQPLYSAYTFCFVLDRTSLRSTIALSCPSFHKNNDLYLLFSFVFNFSLLLSPPVPFNMNYEMEDTQNSAPGSLPPAQAAKLGVPRRAADAHSTTKRYVSLLQILYPS